MISNHDLSTTEASGPTVREYLLRSTTASPAQVDAVLSTERAGEIVERGRSLRSHAGYTGDQVATAFGMTEDPDFDPDDDGYDDEEGS